MQAWLAARGNNKQELQTKSQTKVNQQTDGTMTMEERLQIEHPTDPKTMVNLFPTAKFVILRDTQEDLSPAPAFLNSFQEGQM